MKTTLVHATLVTVLSVLMFACGEPNPMNPDNTPTDGEGVFLKKPPPPPPPNANPAIAYVNAFTIPTRKGKQAPTGPPFVEAIWVMDANGANKTMLHADYTITGSTITVNHSMYPTWSPSGEQLCFWKSDGLYTMSVTVINGVPTASNVTQIIPSAAGVSYVRGVWSPGAAEIATVEHLNSAPSSIRIFTTSGTPVRTIYTSAAGSTLHDHLTYSPDGSKIACFEIESSGDRYLRVIDAVTGTILKNVPMNGFNDLLGLDWSKSSGSSILVFSHKPPSCSGLSRDIYTVDIAGSTGPVLLFVDGEYPSWSSDDAKIAFEPRSGSNGCDPVYSNIRAYDVTSGSSVLLATASPFLPDWKR